MIPAELLQELQRRAEVRRKGTNVKEDSLAMVILELADVTKNLLVSHGLTSEEDKHRYLMTKMSEIDPKINTEEHTILDERDAIIALGVAEFGLQYPTLAYAGLDMLWQVQDAERS